MEMQRGVVGDLSVVPAAAAATRATGTIDRLALLLRAARAAGVPVVHCTAVFRPDRAGSFRNMPSVNRLLENPDHLVVGTPPTEVLPELRDATDLESPRFHGISPFTDTALDSLLRSLGVQAVVATGVSLNRGVTGMVIEAVNRGYEVWLPRDCVVGYPFEYGEAVLEHSLAAISHVTDSVELAAAWAAAGPLAAPPASGR
jgi:nicotinamidase-related amidase